MDILPENSKKEYPNSVTELLRLEEKRFVQSVCLFINKIPNKKIYIRGLTAKFANSPQCACRGSSGKKPKYGLMT
jgi:hypothetical protein